MLIMKEEDILKFETFEDYLKAETERIRGLVVAMHAEFRRPRPQADLCQRLYNLRLTEMNPLISATNGVAFNTYSATCCLMVLRGYDFEKALDITMQEDRARVPAAHIAEVANLFNIAKEAVQEDLRKEASENSTH